jgi:glycosyltransferase involved in cell wall biosynthesis
MNPRVVFVINGFPPDFIGGAEFQALNQAIHLSKLGVDITVVSKGKINNCIKLPFSRVTSPEFKPKIVSDTFLVIKLYLFLLKNRSGVDLVHIHSFGLLSEIACRIASWFSLPTIVKVPSGGKYGEPVSHKKMREYLGNRSISYPKRFIAISSEIRQDLLDLGVSNENIIDIPNGIVVEQEIAERLEDESVKWKFLDKYRVPREKKVFAYFGRLASYKGIQFLIESWKSMDTDFHAAHHLIICGPISIDSPYDIQQDAFQDSSNVTIIKNVIAKDTFLRSIDVLVLPSLAEGMTNVVMEAIIYGKPIIATKVGAIPDLLLAGEGGVLVEPGDSRDLSIALLRVSQMTKKQLMTLTSNSLIGLKKYDIRLVSKEIYKLYLSIIQHE